MSNQQGFSLIEVLLAIALIALLSGLAAPVFLRLQTKNDLDLAAVSLAQSLRRAQVLAQAVDGDTTWGVKAQSGSIVIFKGVNYTARDTLYDESFDLATGISLSGTTEYVFSKFTGLPQTTGSVTLSTENDTQTVTLNAKGMVNY